MSLTWQFDERKVDDGLGWNNSLVGEFRNNQLKSLVCEILQNSLDNPDKDKVESDPVKVFFTEELVETNSIPDIDGLKSHVLACANEKALERETKTSQQEIKRAVDLINEEKIKILKISDANTTGLLGPDKTGEPFHSYIKTEGIQVGNNERGGTHGHGKAAPLSLSNFRTILVSTTWRNRETAKLEKLFQGRATLATHVQAGRNFDFKGYLGNPDFRAVSSYERDTKWLDHGDEQGTTIRVLGWKPPTFAWKHILIGYAIAIYFSAILKGKLSLTVGDLELNKENFSSYFSNKNFLEALEKNDPDCLEEVQLAKWYSKLFSKNSQVKHENKQVQILGNSTISILVEDEAPCKFGILRNDILITSSLQTFYKRRQPTINDFVGIYECVNQKGYDLLRGMEPPQHDGFSQDWLFEDDREEGRRALNHLGANLKQVLRKYAEKKISAGNEIEWMRDFFGDIGGDGQEVDGSEDINPDGELIFAPKPKPIPSAKTIWEIEVDPEPDDDQDDDDQEDDDQEDDDQEDDDQEDDDQEDDDQEDDDQEDDDQEDDDQEDDDQEDDEKPVKTKLVDRSGAIEVHSRYIVESGNTGKIICRTKETGSHIIRFYEMGADLPEEIMVKSLVGSIINNGERYIELKEGRTELKVEFKREVLGGLKVLIRKNL